MLAGCVSGATTVTYRPGVLPTVTTVGGGGGGNGSAVGVANGCVTAGDYCAGGAIFDDAVCAENIAKLIEELGLAWLPMLTVITINVLLEICLTKLAKFERHRSKSREVTKSRTRPLCPVKQLSARACSPLER